MKYNFAQFSYNSLEKITLLLSCKPNAHLVAWLYNGCVHVKHTVACPINNSHARRQI